MMKRFKCLVWLVLIFCNPIPKAGASMNSEWKDESAQDMLVEGATEENENEDASSRWGKSAKTVRAQKVVQASPLEAIKESSFATEQNRAPASMRAPATVKNASKNQAKKKYLPSEKTMVRTLREKKAYQEAAVIVNDLGFFPSTLFATLGVPVRLFVTGASSHSQCMILDAFGVRRQIRSNKIEEVTFTPDQPGKFSFTCPMNGARGTLIVKELQVFERLPASERVSAARDSNEGEAAATIQDEDFGPEFRLK